MSAPPTVPARRVAVLGAGSWGTALAVSLSKAGHEVVLWVRQERAAERIRRERHNPTYLPEVEIPEAIGIVSRLVDAVGGSDFWVFATPSHAVRAVAAEAAPYARGGHLIVSVAKGIENGTLMTTTQVLAQALPRVPASRIGVLYGPSHAEEVAAGVPTAVVAAAGSEETAAEIQLTFMTPQLRVYVNSDLIGVEIAGSVKNVMAIAAGISDGIGFGDNTKAALVTRGLAEIRRLGLAMGAVPSTFSGLAGIGDLVVTCMSRFSRNRFLGEQIGRGRTLAEVEHDMSMVAEGVRTTVSVLELAGRYGIEMPITQAVYAILFEGKKPREAVGELMNRAAKREDWLPESLPEE